MRFTFWFNGYASQCGFKNIAANRRVTAYMGFELLAAA
jgi:hypothetical protein